MKKVVIFSHGEIYPEFIKGGFLHREYENKSKRKICWHSIFGYLNSQSENFYLVQEALKNADIFICDSDNTNLDVDMGSENSKIEGVFFNNLIQSLSEIKKKNKKLKIFIKNLPYTPKEKIDELSSYGKIIRFWFDVKVLTDLK